MVSRRRASDAGPGLFSTGAYLISGLREAIEVQIMSCKAEQYGNGRGPSSTPDHRLRLATECEIQETKPKLDAPALI